MVLENQDGRKCEIRFNTHAATQKWFVEMSMMLMDISKLKKEGLG